MCWLLATVLPAASRRVVGAGDRPASTRRGWRCMGVGVADVALAGEATHGAPCTKYSRLTGGGRGDLLHLGERQLARQHDLRKPTVLQEARLAGVADVGLRAGVELDRRQVELEQAHVPRSGASTPASKVPDQLARRLDLVVEQGWCWWRRRPRRGSGGRAARAGDLRDRVVRGRTRARRPGRRYGPRPRRG